MKRTMVTKSFIEEYLEMAEDLHGLADCNGDVENRRRLKKYINKAKKYLNKFEE